MPTYAYRARSQTGQEVSGTIVAETSAAAARLLDDRALLPVAVDEVKQNTSMLGGGPRRISSSKVGQIYEQLADLLNAGVPVLRSLDVLSKQASHGELSRVLREVHDDVAGGDTLAEAMKRHPHAFLPLHVSMIEAGEKGGFLEDVLTRVSEFVVRQDELRNKFIGSLIYPCILATAGAGAVVFLMLFVVPRMRSLLERQELPVVTKIVFSISDTLQAQWLPILGVVLLVVIALSAFFQSDSGRVTWAMLQLKSPGVGRIYTMVALCRFCRIFGTLLANGIPILHALQIAKDSTGNVLLSEVVEKAADNVSAGEPLAQPLGRSKLFPPAMIDMIAVAEESNTLEKVLIEIANTQEARTGRQIELFVRILEPLMLMLMGAVVMLIAIALLVPILQMATSGFKG